MPGFQEILVIAVVALLVFGPDRLPELARTAGKTLAKFREETRRNVDELKRVADVQDLEKELKSLRNEMRGTKKEMTRGIRDMAGLDSSPTGDGNGRRHTRTDAPGAPEPTAVLRADDQPPPTDPEAT